jgi:hypothetical protein
MENLGLVGDSPMQFCPFLTIQRVLLQRAATQIDFRRPAQPHP